MDEQSHHSKREPHVEDKILDGRLKYKRDGKEAWVEYNDKLKRRPGDSGTHAAVATGKRNQSD